jgi:hypothetical protein
VAEVTTGAVVFANCMTRSASQASCGDWRSRYADEVVVVPVLDGVVVVVPVLGPDGVVVPLPVLVAVVVLLPATGVVTGTTVHQ